MLVRRTIWEILGVGRQFLLTEQQCVIINKKGNFLFLVYKEFIRMNWVIKPSGFIHYYLPIK